MPKDNGRPGWVTELLRERGGVLRSADAVRWLGRDAVRWRLTCGRWQQPCRGVVVTHNGTLDGDQFLWAAVLGAGPGTVIAGLTAARLDGLTGFDESPVHVLIPASRTARPVLPGVRVHRSTVLTSADIHPARVPPRTRLPRSLIDAAAWAPTDTAARSILAAGVQQGLLPAGHLTTSLASRARVHRHALIATTLADISAGAHALSELDFAKLVRRHKLPAPDRQVMRLDGQGRRRWLDAYWDGARLVAEIDGMWHMEALAWWADMRRDNDLTIHGYRVLRFPAFAIREEPMAVVAQLRAALGLPRLAVRGSG